MALPAIKYNILLNIPIMQLCGHAKCCWFSTKSWDLSTFNRKVMLLYHFYMFFNVVFSHIYGDFQAFYAHFLADFFFFLFIDRARKSTSICIQTGHYSHWASCMRLSYCISLHCNEMLHECNNYWSSWPALDRGRVLQPFTAYITRWVFG